MDNITHRIAESIRANDFYAYQRERYPAIQEGEFVRFTDEDFSGVDFDQFVMGFSCFRIVIWTTQSTSTGNRFILSIRRFGMWIFVA